jgi:two-component system, NarL family, response regulator DevR
MTSQLALLIVEDERVVALSLSRLFAAHGRVEVVSTLSDARRALDDVRFNALIVDVKLPDGSGFDVLDYALQRAPDIDALVLSGGVDATRLARAYSLGVTYLMKPVNGTLVQQFVLRARARRLKNAGWLRGLLTIWVARYNLTPAEAEVLSLAIDGVSRTEIAERRHVSLATLKKQVQSLIAKTGDSSLEGAANRALRAAIDQKS